ncbi:MAG TPA: DUF2069 domain-containing protein [Cellvibrio sp.]|nr:DUF2069 domain-containing protein [Cellvibrio sp.]
MSELPSREHMQDALVSVEKKLSLGLIATHSSYALLLILITWLNFQLPENGIALWLFKILPLAIFIPAFIKGYYRSYSWLCFAILPYFIWIIPLALGRGSFSDWAIVALTVIIFNAAMMSSRWMQQQSYLRWQMANTPATE